MEFKKHGLSSLTTAAVVRMGKTGYTAPRIVCHSVFFFPPSPTLLSVSLVFFSCQPCTAAANHKTNPPDIQAHFWSLSVHSWRGTQPHMRDECVQPWVFVREGWENGRLEWVEKESVGGVGWGGERGGDREERGMLKIPRPHKAHFFTLLFLHSSSFRSNFSVETVALVFSPQQLKSQLCARSAQEFLRLCVTLCCCLTYCNGSTRQGKSCCVGGPEIPFFVAPSDVLPGFFGWSGASGSHRGSTKRHQEKTPKAGFRAG